MAIYHLSAKPISRGSGRSAVASAAYRCAQRLINERDGLVHDFTRKQGVEHTEIVLPEGIDADWALDRSSLWNAAEFAEKRKDARVAREFEVALPHELSMDGRIGVVREFAQELANRYGAAVDFAVHAPHRDGDIRNWHAHVMMTTRQVGQEGLGDKTYLEHKNARLLANGMATTDMQLRDIRQAWEGIANHALAREGLDVRIDHRSHEERGLEVSPTEHMGVHATQIDRRGAGVDRARLDAEAASKNADLIRKKPEQVLTLITAEKSVFDRHDIARTLHRYINDDAQAFQNAFAAVMASPALKELQVERVDEQTGQVELAKYSTREMVNLEWEMARSAERMTVDHSYGVDRLHAAAAMMRQDVAIAKASGDYSARLSGEQRQAIAHITGPERIAAVVGFAGAGKSTMLAAARETWEAQGYRVHGAALSGKAAEGLEESSGIESRTLASWAHGWERDRNQIGRGDVFVIDEAGMVGSRQLARFVNEVEQSGAKLVLVGDHEQLQAIGAGAPFRAIAEQIGYAELSDIRRQREDWQREASVSFATHKTAEGLAAYRDRGYVRFAATREEVLSEIVRDYLADRDDCPGGTRVAMAHRRVDVRAINEGIRAEFQARGELAKVMPADEIGGGGARGKAEDLGLHDERDERDQRPAFTYQTNDGKRDFALGDRIVFLENDRELGVKNGMLGTVEHVADNRIIAKLDGRGGDSVSIPTDSYRAFDHGYATTIHKNQGATVDRAFVMASGTMDRHLTYVAMTRHRDGVKLYANQEEFAGRKSGQNLMIGKLVEHGVAPFEHKAGNRDSYFVTLETARGERQTTWGVGLQAAIQQAKAEIGATIGIRHEGSVSVTLPDGTETHRNAWRVQNAGELAYGQLAERLSRSGVKETTLDFSEGSAERQFAERRGIAEAIGLRSEIDLSRAQNFSQDLPRLPREDQERLVGEHRVDEERVHQIAAPDHQPDIKSAGRELSAPVARAEAEAVASQAHRPRRSMFDGLKLNAGRSGVAERPSREGERQAAERTSSDRLSERVRAMSAFEQAVDRYAQAYSRMDRQLQEKLPILEGQMQAYRLAARELDQARPGSHALIRSAMQYDPKTSEAMTEHSGRERVSQLIAGMDRERALQADPNVRAERFTARWSELRAERQELRGSQHDQARGKVEGEMRGMSQSLSRDPELQSTLRSRAQELGVSHLGREQNLAQEMERQLTQSRSQSQGLER
ncbi:Ti-type conjugative transfer relaxase TraA (plasmid) [Shinella sumterensis]|nr:Ti-type conjugative transfer relaxase TraA [Shinella sumterensis]